MNRIDLAKFRPLHLDLAGGTVCVLLSAVAYFAGIRPLLTCQEEITAAETRLGAQRGNARQRAEHVAEMANNVSHVKHALARNPVQLEPTHRVNLRIARLASLAAECGMKIDEIQPGVVFDGPRFQTVPIHILGRGDYPTCVLLIRRIRKIFPDTAIKSFGLAGNPHNPAAGAGVRLNLLWCAAKSPAPKR